MARRITVSEVLDRGVDEIENSLSDEPAVRSNLMRAMGQAYNGLGLYPKARALLAQGGRGRRTAAEAARD